MYEAVKSPYLVPFDGSFRVKDASHDPPKGAPDKKECRERLERSVAELSELQEVLFADDRWAILLVFQAMDAAGKDGTIRALLSGVNPAGCQVFSFKAPTVEELDHDFLWRTTRCLPEQGRIGVFNRSYYEEVLVVKVHPEFLAQQKLPQMPGRKSLWEGRYESIREHEKHLARNGTVVIKFWLNVSKAEQRRRFLARLDEREKHWKFTPNDVREREHWKEYMEVYEDAIRNTSKSWAPWYTIPADDKPYMRMVVADIVVRSLNGLGLRWPKPVAGGAELEAMQAELQKEGGSSKDGPKSKRRGGGGR